MSSRREFVKLAAGAVLPGVATASDVGGVRVGAQSNSFSDRGLDAAIQAMVELGIRECELWQGHVEPLPAQGSGAVDMSKWRQQAPSSHFREIAQKLRNAGISLDAYDFQFRESFTDREIERGLEIGRELGVKCMVTSSATLSLAKRMAPFLEKHKMPVGMHGRANTKDANEFAGPASFLTALGYSSYIGVNLDIGHFTAAGFDAVPFIEKHHDRIVSIHLKDRRRNQGPSVAFGQGDTPIRQCLQLLNRNLWRIPAHIEYDRGGDRVAGFRESYEFCKRALA